MEKILLPALFLSGRMHLDVALVQVTPPDNFGFCSLGVSVEAVKAAAESAELVIAQVNKQMPRTLGDSFIHVEELDVIVEHEEPILEVPPSEPDDVALAIARHATRLIENGSTIQIGIGKIPNAILYGLAEKKDLGVHDERLFQEYLYRLSEQSAYLRFFQIRKAFPHKLAQQLVAVDYKENLGIVGALGTSDTSPIVTAAHWMLDVNENMAEVAFSVADEYQRRGIGTHLLKFLMRIAKEQGIRGFNAIVLAGNTAMMKVFQKSGCILHTEYDSGVISLSFRFDEKEENHV